MPSSSIELLSRLHKQNITETMARARGQFRGSNEEFLKLAEQYNTLAPRLRGEFLRTHGLSSNDAEFSQGTDLLLAISPDMGRFLQNMALSHQSHRILELGSSCGVSTLYFAEALYTLGRGTVIATEFDSTKCAQLRENTQISGLESFVDLREGDVFKTISKLEGTFDIVFIDIWADAYLRLFKQIEHLLRPGSIILTDNMYTADEAVQPYKHYLDQNPRFSSTTLDFESGVEFTVVLS